MIVSLLPGDTKYGPAIEAALGEKIIVCKDRAEAMQLVTDAEVIITLGTGNTLFDKALLSVCRQLRLVLSISTGVEKLPLKELNERGVAVCNTSGAQAVSVAEYVIGAMLGSCHAFPQFLKNQEKKLWRNIFCSDLDGQTLCILGTGQIGKEIAKRAKAFNMTVIGLNRHGGPVAHFDEVWDISQLHRALSLAAYAVLAVPLTTETEKLMGETEFRAMKQNAVLINISRGGTIDEEALINALEENVISCAILDVFSAEPLPPESPLWSLGQVFITPHNSAYTQNTDQKVIKLLCDNIYRFRHGQPLTNQIPPSFC